MKRVFIYTLTDPTTNLIRYVGRSYDPKTRFRHHLSHSKNGANHSQRWIRKLVEAGVMPRMEIIELVSEDWREREKYWIKYFRDKNCPLTNISEGGQGCLGLRHSEDTIKRLREIALKDGRCPPRGADHYYKLSQLFTGRHHTQEAKDRISKRFRGKSLSVEHKNKLKERKIALYAQNNKVRDALSRYYGVLTDEQVLEVWRLTVIGEISQEQIAKRYGIPASTVSEIRTGKRYKHVARPMAPMVNPIISRGLERKRKCVELFRRGKPISEIAEILNLTVDAISRHIRADTGQRFIGKKYQESQRRERRVGEMLAARYSNRDIASDLKITMGGVWRIQKRLEKESQMILPVL